MYLAGEKWLFFCHVELAHGDISIIPAKYARRDAQETVRYGSPGKGEHLGMSSQHGRVAGRSTDGCNHSPHN